MEVPIVKRHIYTEEWWPVYELHHYDEDDVYGTAVQIPEDLVHRYAKAYAEFKNVQIILRSLYEEKD